MVLKTKDTMKEKMVSYNSVKLSEEKGTEENANGCPTDVKVPASEDCRKTSFVKVPAGEKDTYFEIPVVRKAKIVEMLASQNTEVKIPIRGKMRGTNLSLKDFDELSANGKSDNIPDEEIDKKTTIKAMEYKALPECIKKRIQALKALQVKVVDNDAKFFQDVFKLEVQQDSYRKELLQKRLSILNGEYEPTEEDCDYTSDDESIDNVKIEKENSYPIYDEKDKGIPKFWLTALKNASMLCETIMDDDEPILAHLQDIRVKFHESPYGFTLEFHFSENEYFTNEVLTKYYRLKIEPTKNDPFSFEGPEIIDCKGCQIDWKADKDATAKIIRKLNLHPEDPNYLTATTKTAQKDSFFKFFNPHPVPETLSEMSDTIREMINQDFDIGHFIKDRMIPRAVLYYTGEAFDDDDDDYEDCEEEEEEEEDETENENVDAEEENLKE